MLPKTHGAVGCAHCQRLGATAVCSSCGQLVCRACRLTLERCPRPRPLHVQLELPPGFNIAQADDSGRLALGVNKRGQSKVILLPVGQVLRTIGRNVAWPQLAGAGQLIVPVIDQRRLLFARTLRIEDAGAGSVRRLVDGYNGEPVQIIVSADERIALVVGAEGILYAVDLVDDRELCQVQIGRAELLRVTAAAAARDSGLVALGRTGTVLLYRLADGAPAAQIPTQRRKVKWLGLAGRRLVAIGDGGRLEVWDLEEAPDRLSWQTVLQRPLGDDVVYNVSGPDREVGLRQVKASLSPDGRLLAVRRTYPPRIMVIDLATGRPAALDGHGYLVTELRFIRRGVMLLSMDIGGEIIYWPCGEGEVITASRATG